MDVLRSSASKPPTKMQHVDLLVAGSIAIDLSCDFIPKSGKSVMENDVVSGDASRESLTIPILGTSNASTITQSLGGVGQNVASAAHYLGASVRLCSAVGNDIAGHTALRILQEKGVDTSEIRMLGNGKKTAQYVAVNDMNRNLFLAMADMSILQEDSDDPGFATLWQPSLTRFQPKWLVLDANFSGRLLKAWAQTAQKRGIRVAFEPVSHEKSKRLFSDAAHKYIDLITPNESELHAMAVKLSKLVGRKHLLHESALDSKLAEFSNTSLVRRGVPQSALMLLSHIPCVLTKLGAEGVLMSEIVRHGDARLTDSEAVRHITPLPDEVLEDGRYLGSAVDLPHDIAGVYMRIFPAAEDVPQEDIVSVNGVGDTFLGIIIAGLAKEHPQTLEQLIPIGQKGSVMTLKSADSVSLAISSLRSSI